MLVHEMIFAPVYMYMYTAGEDIHLYMYLWYPLGYMCCISNIGMFVFQGIIERDKIVFEKVRRRNIPILMVTSGGYQRSTARIIADSVLNLRKLKLIGCDEAELAAPQSKGWLDYFFGF